MVGGVEGARVLGLGRDKLTIMKRTQFVFW